MSTTPFDEAVASVGNTQADVASPPVTPALTDTQKGELTQLQQEFRDVQDIGIPYHRGRASNFRAQHNWVSSIGKDAVSKHAETILGMKSEARTLSYVMAAQAVTGINVYAEKDVQKRHALHNQVTPVAKMLEALAHFRDKHQNLPGVKSRDLIVFTAGSSNIEWIVASTCSASSSLFAFEVPGLSLLVVLVSAL